MLKKPAPSSNPIPLRAVPEQEDFAHKYTDEGRGKIGARLIDGYFKSVQELVVASGVGEGKARRRAIELGCGEGFSTQRLRGMLPDTVQLEASEYVVAMVPRAQKRNPGVPVTQESVYELKHEDASFDLIFLLEVLEHLDYPDRALAEVARILKPGGYLVVGVPREPLWSALNLARGKYVRHFGNTTGHLNHWTAGRLKRFITKHFGEVRQTRTPLPWSLVLAQKRR